MKNIKKWIERQIRKGYTQEQIREFLEKKGHDSKIVDEYFEEKKHSNNINSSKKSRNYVYGIIIILVFVFGLFLLSKNYISQDIFNYVHPNTSEYFISTGTLNNSHYATFFSFDDFYLNDLEEDKYKVHTFSLFKDGCTSILYISDREDIFTKIIVTPQDLSSIFYNNGYFYSFIGCDYNESIKTSQDIQKFIGNFESLETYLNNNYKIIERKKQLYMIKNNIQLSETDYIDGGILLPSETIEIGNQTLYIYDDKTLIKKEKRFFIFKNSYNLTEEEFHNNIEDILGELFL